MKRVLLILVGITLASLVWGQSLLTDNPFYRQAEELKQQAREAIEEGRYEESIALSAQAEDYHRQAEEWAELQVLRYRASGWKSRAEQRLDYAESIDAPENFPREFTNAEEFYGEGQELFADEDYAASIQPFQNVVDALEGVRPIRTVEPRPEPEPKPEPEPAEAVLPAFYRVRLIPERRDSFWRIAEYDFVYGNPWLWPRLYEANKGILHDPDNPDLIHPGMLFEIPPREGEEREGIWNEMQENEDGGRFAR